MKARKMRKKKNINNEEYIKYVEIERNNANTRTLEGLSDEVRHKIDSEGHILTEWSSTKKNEGIVEHYIINNHKNVINNYNKKHQDNKIIIIHIPKADGKEDEYFLSFEKAYYSN